MKSFRSILLLISILAIHPSVRAQSENTTVFSVAAGLEFNYIGVNETIGLNYKKADHNFELGLMHGHSGARLGLGLGIDYLYGLINSSSADQKLGLAYRSYKPLKELNTHLFMLESYTLIKPRERINVYMALGYGLALEKIKTVNVNTSRNDLTGMFRLGCVYHI